MKSLIASASLGLLLRLASAPASASVIDFEAQAANRGGNLTGIPDSPLTIGIATFTGGELRSGLINLRADETGVYASEGLFGSGETNPLVITFATPVSDCSPSRLFICSRAAGTSRSATTRTMRRPRPRS